MATGLFLLSRPAVQVEPNLTSQPPDGVNAHSRLSRAAVAVTRTGSGPSADTALGGTVSRDQARPFQVSAHKSMIPLHHHRIFIRFESSQLQGILARQPANPRSLKEIIADAKKQHAEALAYLATR